MVRFLFDRRDGTGDQLIARWLFLRALGLIYFSAFYSLLFQVRGLIGVQGILPAGEYLSRLHSIGWLRFWYAPTLLWVSSGDATILAVCWVGLTASVLALANVMPRVSLLVCFACFLSFVTAAQEFSQYQSDGMLLEAGFLSLFLAPGGWLPGWGRRSLPCRAAMVLLLWEWLRIYFESGVVKLESGDPAWRNLTAMYEYYQNGPLPTWMGWYMQHLPNWFHRGTAGLTFVVELVIVWMALLPGRWRVVCFCVVTVWQVGVIATANYAFLNYLVLVLAVLLLNDRILRRFVPRRWRRGITSDRRPIEIPDGASASSDQSAPPEGSLVAKMRVVGAGIALSWIAYASTALLIAMIWRGTPLPMGPVTALEPFRIANEYGLFAVMTPHRYEIEFQGSEDGRNWTAYDFRYKPQDVREKPRIYAPYQPRFEWNLWFASLGVWQENRLVVFTEEKLLSNDAPVLQLFRRNPFENQPPKLVRAVLWQYWFSTPDEKRTQGVWWRRTLLGTYAPTLERLPDGQYGMRDPASLDGPPSP